MFPAYIVHEKFKTKLSTSACFSDDGVIDLATTHLKNPTGIRSILQKRAFTHSDIHTLTAYPNGVMFIEFGGRVENGKFMNDFSRTCWDAKTQKSAVYLDRSDEDWHIHPWNLVGVGRPNFFSMPDIDNAILNKKIKHLFIGHPFRYRYPRHFILDTRNILSEETVRAIFERFIKMLGECTPFIDPQVDWDKLCSELKSEGVVMEVVY